MVNRLLPYTSLLLLILIISVAASMAQGPVIDVWYGNSQKFGHVGNPQNWVNILGNVSDPDGVKQISYNLNGGNEVVLSLGPDGRRLQNKGDFNVDLLSSTLTNGINTIVITAIDSLDNSNATAVNVEYKSGKYWNKTYHFQWDTVTNIQNVVQVVDGKWELTSNGIRTVEAGYDRLIAIGDTSWMNYEIKVPITVHEIKPPLSQFAGNDYGLGLLVRWTGHTDTPVSGWQPKSGFLPLGDIGWFNWPRSNTANTQLNFFYSTNTIRTSFGVENGKTYIFKLQVATKLSGHSYSLKVWEQGTQEPTNWTIENLRGPAQLKKGSFMFVAHHVDATYGNVSVFPIVMPVPHFTYRVDEEDFHTFYFDASSSNISEGSIISYTWDFGDGTTSGGNTTSHSFLSEGLYDVKLTVTSAAGYSDDYILQINVRDYSIPSEIVSDDFSGGETLNTDIWEFISPTGDGSFAFNTIENDKVINLIVPSGSAHEVWNGVYNPVAIMQSTNDTNLEVEVKFLSDVNQMFQQQGLLVQESTEKLIRADFYSNGTRKYFFVATFLNGVPTIQTNTQLNDQFIDGMYLKIKRTVDEWVISYSSDGVNWVTGSDFNFTMQVKKVGVYGGNAGTNPSHTAAVDYFFNSIDPIVPEDGIEKMPGADFEFSVDSENVLLVHFDASKSVSYNGAIASYEWDFGDGSTAAGVDVSHEYDVIANYDVKLVVKDERGNADSITKTIKPGVAGLAFISDDFDDDDLNTTLWEFVNPALDGTYEILDEVTSSVLALTVPAGTRHEIWENIFTPVGVAQNCKDIDFEIEAKFESGISKRFQQQGVMVLGSSNKILRIETYSDGSKIFLFAASIQNSTSIIYLNEEIEFDQVVHLKVNRSADTWKIDYSLNGSNWEERVTFTYTMNVQKVGAYGGNSGSNPLHIAKLDYFFNNADRIEPEDPNSSPVTGIENIKESEFALYPNPTSNYFNLDYTLLSISDVYFDLYNAQGQLVKSTNLLQLDSGNHTTSFTSEGLVNGIYILKVTLSNTKAVNVVSRKIVIE